MIEVNYVSYSFRLVRRRRIKPVKIAKKSVSFLTGQLANGHNQPEIPSGLAFDDSGQHHQMLRTDGFGILIGRTGKGGQVPANIGHFGDLIHQTVLGTV